MFNFKNKKAQATPVVARDQASVIEEELIYGAARREAFWKKYGTAGWVFGGFGCIMAAIVAASHETPAPVLVPFDPSTGMALPMVNLEAIAVQQRDAVVQSLQERSQHILPLRYRRLPPPQPIPVEALCEYEGEQVMAPG